MKKEVVYMDTIMNSPVKEGFRQRNENVAKNYEAKINQTLAQDIQRVRSQTDSNIAKLANPQTTNLGDMLIMSCFLAIVIAVIGAFVDGFNGFIVGGFYGFLLAYALQIGFNIRAKIIQKNTANETVRLRQKEANTIQQLQMKAKDDVRRQYLIADQRTQDDITHYDADVKSNYQTILKETNSFKSMVDHTVSMFQRMVSHADSSSNRKFVEAKFIYKVEMYGIIYIYQSNYSNSQDDFNFDKERYRNLTTQAECEGLAQAIAKMTIVAMKNIYPPNSLSISVDHVDAEVTLHFKAANANYVPPRDIY